MDVETSGRSLEDSILIVSPRRRGRPPAERPGTAMTPMTAWVPTQLHERLCRLAAERDMSVSSLVKQMLLVQLRRR